ncbi:hypothetical protein B0H10DRAFT_2007511 [Mycena sp. CBHHK59/15]|nr:hypothetical protein B0H10DRAFT_2007511 [Mycena sp. CBHHK59/15]
MHRPPRRILRARWRRPPQARACTSRSTGGPSPTCRQNPNGLVSLLVPAIPQVTMRLTYNVHVVPIYTPAELMSLAQSPLTKQFSGAMHAALRDQEFPAIALSKRQQRSREYMQRKNAAAPTESTPNTVTPGNPAPRRRPGGRVDPRRRNLNPASRFAGLDGALSWRAQMRRMDMVAPAVSLAA